MQGHHQHTIGAGGNEKIGYQTPTYGNPWRILLVGAGIGVVWDHGRDATCRCPARSIQHQEQLDQVFLNGRHQRLNEKDIPLPTVGLQLHAQAIVGKALQLTGEERNLQLSTDLSRQLRMGASTEDRDFAHGSSWVCTRGQETAVYARREPSSKPRSLVRRQSSLCAPEPTGGSPKATGARVATAAWRSKLGGVAAAAPEQIPVDLDQAR